MYNKLFHTIILYYISYYKLYNIIKYITNNNINTNLLSLTSKTADLPEVKVLVADLTSAFSEYLQTVQTE